MKATQAKENPELKAFVQSMSEAMGNKLLSVVLYGSAARGDFVEKTSDLNLILVLEDLFPLTLEKLSAPMRKWTKKGQPIPQLFTPALIAESADVFPMEMLDLQNSRLVLFGRDAFEGLPVSRTHLRLQ
ncbi:MAG TPA: nucleotidyltransferase domain-containing protein, partial [Candidatus Polarisedimenticolia bacterium]|nr:nucleotidyltransferase domain-containing protein [Candidatus Polarisedimenticolia bacterium]